MRRLNRTLGLSALMLAAVACDDDRTSVLTPVGDISIGTPVGAAVANVPSGTVEVAGGSALIRGRALRAVTGAAYRTWYVSRDPVSNVDVYTPAFGSVLERFSRDSLSGGTTGTPVPDPITGETIQVTDTNEVSLTRTGSYAGTDNPAVFEAIIQMDSAADVGTTTPATGRNAVVLSLGDGSGADAQFLFRRIGVVGGGALTFGNFGGTDAISGANPADYVYTPSGNGVANFRGAEVSVDFRELPRPPRGYFYRGFLVDTAESATLVDTLRSAYNPLAGISRVSLFDADVNLQLPGIAVTSITHSQVRNCGSGAAIPTCANGLTISDFAGQALFVLTLDPKGAGAALGKTVILAGEIPLRVSESN